LTLQLINGDSKNRKMTMEIVVDIVVDNVYAVSFKKTKIFGGGGGGNSDNSSRIVL
jgi:hypothetical protein